MRSNTFGEYEFDDWVPERVREMIRDFWGQMGRTHEDWLGSALEQGVREVCYHEPGPNGFGMPPYGATADYFATWGRKDGEWIQGRYIHTWNNMGMLIDKDGTAYLVSTVDRWVRVWTSQQEKEEALA